ncbi:MAG: phosphoglucosamine mutase [Candidatus Eremiobacteraeota bacterium]|nr:phosphoglucosamine mutase [Candidatus Eremiobacteraeota bacterium]
MNRQALPGARLFGTDGVRGVANRELTPELALGIGRAAGGIVAARSPRERAIVVGRDTRLSGTMLEAAVVAGITSTGRDALAVGVIPTPGVARITVAVGAAGGVMISASHNPIEDNGIKVFGPDGFKLDDAGERELEAACDGEQDLPRPTHGGVGIVRSAPQLVERYVERLLEDAADLSSLTLVVDAAFGAAYEIAPRAFAQVGATVEPLHAQDDGSRINVACGSTDLRLLARRVRALAAERPAAHVIGVAFDGDADRALFVDEAGDVKNGDHIMLMLGRDKKRRGILARDTVVGTVMSNVGLERALHAEGIGLVRAAVGDRYVLAEMRAHGFMFGGEQSGHVIDLERNTTGDGLATALAVASLVVRDGRTLRELGAALTVAPQVLVNVHTHDRSVLGDEAVQSAIARIEGELGTTGRILVRASGTEPLIRVMIEGDDRTRIEHFAREVAETVERADSGTSTHRASP